jgi:XTP/dITP diphosphohydrolase
VTRAPVVVLRTARTLPGGLMTARGWAVVRDRHVYAADPQHPLLDALRAEGLEAAVLRGSPDEVAATVRGSLPATLIASDGDEAIVGALAAGGEVETVVGSEDPPGARLLDAVRVMDRLRSPGGCPWDAEQTHASLAKYLLEEAYETIELIESGQLAELAEEIGDVLLQVLFHSRLASERTDGTGWDVDDVAAGLVEKLVRRHPHVFGDVAVDGSAAVVANWDVLKAQEKGRTSVTEGVPLAQPALALAEKLLARAGRAGLPEWLADEALHAVDPVTALQRLLTAAPAAIARDADDAAIDRAADAYIGRVLLLTVALARRVGVNPETALRASSRQLRERILAAEAAGRV